MKINTRFLGLRLTVLLLFLGFAWLAFEQVTQEINRQWGKQFVERQVLFDKALYAAKAAGRNCVNVGMTRIGKVNDLTLKEYVARLQKIKKSVALHSTYGIRGYYEFIKEFV